MTAADVVAVAAAADPDAGVGRPRRRWADLIRTGLSVGVAVALVVLLVRHRPMLDAGSDSVARADLAWIGLAAAGTVLLWTAGTVSQLGSVRPRLPLFRLFAVQVAATFANHVLPGGSGGLGGQRPVPAPVRAEPGRRRSVRSALNMLAGGVTHTALLLVALVAAPDALTAALGPGDAAPAGRPPAVLGAGRGAGDPARRGARSGRPGAGAARTVRHVRAQLAGAVRGRAHPAPGGAAVGSARSRCRCCTA